MSCAPWPAALLLVALAIAPPPTHAEENLGISAEPAALAPATTLTPLPPHAPAFTGRQTLEAGLHYSRLDQGNPSWSGAYLKANWQSTAELAWSAELADQKRYGDRGTYLAVGATRVFAPDWYASMYVGAGADAFFLPRYRVDVLVSRKWLAGLQLVTTLGATHTDSRDVHRDTILHAGATYYFSSPWIAEAGLYLNRSEPGRVDARSGFVALTHGRAGDHFLTVRLSAGHEAWQAVGPAATLTDFFSRSRSLNWRQWVTPRSGLNLRAEVYRNPFYRRKSLEVGVFHEL